MNNLVLLMLLFTGMGVYITLSGFVFLAGHKRRPTIKLVMLSVGMFIISVIMLFIV